MILLSVIIVTYKHIDLVNKCLESICKYNDLLEKLEVILVDNSPTGEVYNYFLSKEYNFKFIKIQSTNNGYGSGNNLGVSLANGKYCLFLNPDTELVRPIFYDACLSFEKYDAFGIKLLNQDGTKNYSYRYMYPYCLSSLIKNRLAKKINLFNQKKYYIVGADIFIKKNVFDKIGKFDEKIFMYNEEFDLFQRLNKSNYKVGYNSKLELIHLEGSGTYKKFDINQRVSYLQSFIYVCKKYSLNTKKLLKRQMRLLIFFYICFYFKKEYKRRIIEIKKKYIEKIKEID